MNESPLISVCVCTFHRPALLAELLTSLSVQSKTGFEFEIVVTDNDAAGSARPTIESFRAAHPELVLRYEIEPRAGISHARNHSVAMARGNFLAFIDDDETAAPDWLAELLACQQATHADAVLGPVLPVFPPGSRQWAIDSRLFERPRYPNQSRIRSNDGRTGNALVSSAWARSRQPQCFAEHLAHSGGEDYDFFKWLEAEGGNLTWADSATVSEVVPLSRQCVGFVLERRFRASVTYWRGIYADSSWRRAVMEVAKGLLGGTAYLIAGTPPALFGNLAVAMPRWVKAMNGFGRIGATTRIRLSGYERAE